MRRSQQVIFFILALLLLLLTGLIVQQLSPNNALSDLTGGGVESADWSLPLSYDTSQVNIHGGVIMKELGNQTIKEELGRSTWRLLHTMTARFPKRPSPDEQKALKSFIYLLSRLYPCGQCAKHFQKLLQENPPDVSSRKAASDWACKAHNIVNARLEKPQFDCSKVAETWKCGCADEPKDEVNQSGPGGIDAEDIRKKVW